VSIDRNRLAVAAEWVGERRPLAAATLVEAEGSSPFEPGATMLIDGEGNVEGSVTGGCVESALVQEAAAVLGGGEARLRTYGISDELAAEVGLMCGGTVHVFVSRLDGEPAATLQTALSAAVEERPAGVATLLDGPSRGSRLALVAGETVGSLGAGELLDDNVARELGGMLEHGQTATRRYGADGSTMGSDQAVLLQSFAEPPRMIIFGAIDFSAALGALAREVGYRVAIVDPREPFLRSRRFKEVAETVAEWPDSYLERTALGPRDAVLVFTHDPKLDQPALVAAVRSGAGYVGALGSRRTQRDREARLREAGLSAAEIDEIAAPCGLDIGARTPSETAISILGEVVDRQHGRVGEPLSEGEGPIHASRDRTAGAAKAPDV
jgi:xanthine dehydrogenase accessory factor